MIGTLLRIGWINFRRDRVVQALTFLLPILFFSIFALVFSNQGNAGSSRVQVAVVDEDGSPFSTKIVAALRLEGGLRVRETAEADGSGARLDRAAAEALVKSGRVPVAVVLPAGLAKGRTMWSEGRAAAPKVSLLADVSDPVAPQVVLGLLQKVSFTAAPETMATEGMALFEKYGGPLTPAQQEARRGWLARLEQGTAGDSSTPASASEPFGLATEIVNVMQPDQPVSSMISFYAAGIGVMFLLFSSAGAGGALLDEEESGTLGRLVGSPLGMGGVLLGKWIFLTMMGVAQLTVMFLWGALVFGLPLLTHLVGFAIMTTFTAAAAAAFGLVLATISRSRQQLSGLSTIIILMMSALGGSMFPRFLMSETMQRFGLVTFNGWALDGYLKVFWRNAPLWQLWPQVAVLAALAGLFLLVARRFARRWETA
jgi:ABC-2 type transport system permease protein